MTGRGQIDAGSALRADARRNRERVLDAAREAFARHGFEASYHNIARLAGVGVGTVYRRYPDRDALIEAVLLDILVELTGKAVAAHAERDAWMAFDRFFRTLSDRVHRHAGLSAQLGAKAGDKVEAARTELLDAIEQLCRHAASDLRPGVGWQEVVFLAQATGVDRCGLDAEGTEERRRGAIDIILDGLRFDSRR